MINIIIVSILPIVVIISISDRVQVDTDFENMMRCLAVVDITVRTSTSCGNQSIPVIISCNFSF